MFWIGLGSATVTAAKSASVSSLMSFCGPAPARRGDEPVAASTSMTPGKELEEQLLQAIHAAGQAPLPGARDLPVLRGIDRRGDFLQPQENVLVLAANILVQSGKVFTFGDG